MGITSDWGHIGRFAWLNSRQFAVNAKVNDTPIGKIRLQMWGNWGWGEISVGEVEHIR
jgi:hypothetical protein